MAPTSHASSHAHSDAVPHGRSDLTLLSRTDSISLRRPALARLRTTYSDLTREAAGHLGRALVLIDSLRTSPGTNRGGGLAQSPEVQRGAAAHRDLTDALTHLGRTLLDPRGADRGPGRSRARLGRSSDRMLLTDLEQRAEARDWEAPRPTGTSPAAALDRAARLTRAAADLWATHHSPTGEPRSPEASLMRHPSMLGAATREWRELVVVAGAIADQLLALADSLPAVGSPTQEPVRGEAHTAEHPATQLRRDDLRGLADYPSPAPGPRSAGYRPIHSAATSLTWVDLGVARPGRRRASDPLMALQDRVDHLCRVAWMLADSGTAPIPVLANTAAIGVMLATATEKAHRDRSAGVGAPMDRDQHLKAEAAARATRRWSEVARQVANLRSAHPSANPIQVERIDIARLLDQVAVTERAPGAPSPADALTAALDSYGRVAQHLTLAVRRAQEKGEIFIRGRAVPTEVLSRRPDLLEAKLADRVVETPSTVVRRLERAYADVHPDGSSLGRRRRRSSDSPDRNPAA